MNLTTEPWIPVIDVQGQTRQVNLRQVFTEGDTLQDLVLRPHERVALMRLLICIAQAALDGPADSEELDTCRPELAAAAERYLDKWQGCFDLFHPERPFLQFPGLSKPPKPAGKPSKKAAAAADNAQEGEGTPASKMDFALATGNNSTLFDHGAASDKARDFSAPHLALMLITFQCFAPSQPSSSLLWKGALIPSKGGTAPSGGKTYCAHAPCTPSAMLHAFVRRATLLQTVHANLLSKSTVRKNYGRAWGQPVWELMPESFEDHEAIENATHTYLGRLMPLSRAILLLPGGANVLLSNGLQYPVPPDFAHEPTATLVARRDGTGHVLVGASDKAIWRELSAMVVKRKGEASGGPLAFSDLDTSQGFDLWIGALVASKDEGIVDAVEAVYAIPARMFTDAGRRAYEDEVKESELVALRLAEACKSYRQHLELKPQDYPERTLAINRYWTSIEQSLPLLHAYLNASDGSDMAKAALSQWRSRLWRVAREALSATCASETPRQLRAHALALRTLQRSQRQPEEQPQTN